MTYQQAMDEDPVKQKRYDSAHGAFAGDVAFGFSHVIHGYDWASLGKATIVNMGVASAARANHSQGRFQSSVSLSKTDRV
jgi:hypothetical protein